MNRYRGRAALVTGAGSGIGRATAVLLAAEGARVACLDSGDNDTAATIGPAALDLRADIRDESAVRAAVARTAAWAGRLDLLANVAGVASYAHTTEVTLAEWERLIGVNLTGTFLVTREAMPHLLASRGAVVNVASLAGVRGFQYSAGYSAAKGGVVALTRALAVEYARAGVRVACVCPGAVDTPLRNGLAPVSDPDPVLLARARGLTDPPVAQPEEIAESIAFLGSAAARFATGAVLQVDGGAGV